LADGVGERNPTRIQQCDLAHAPTQQRARHRAACGTSSQAFQGLGMKLEQKI
jgi:hypothetical protein